MIYYSPGKVLLTAEYAVLEGVKAIALPTKRGQSLAVKYTQNKSILWKSYTVDQQLWIDCTFDFNFNCLSSNHTDKKSINQLKHIFEVLKKMVPHFHKDGIEISTSLEFPRNWGLGSSSTLINNLAQWLGLNPYALLDKTMGGSGYDVAAAQSDSAILYQRNKLHPKVKKINFSPAFKDHLFFVHLNQKRDSREAIASYRKGRKVSREQKYRLEKIGEQLLVAPNQNTFNNLLFEHENITATFLEELPVQEHLFADFDGQTKSLGAWGGDFILASGNKNTPDYFKKKGYATCLPFSQFILT